MSGLETDIRLTQGAFTLTARFHAPGDGITALFGPSGAGKSSLLSALAGLKRCEGRVALNGKLCADSASGIFLAAHQRGFGLVFQEPRLFPHLTAGQNLDYAASRAPAARFVKNDVARFFDITALLDRPVGNLSGGEKSRVALARTLLAAPDYLLLDEPFAALDGVRRRAFIAVLLRMHQAYRIPMLVVSHSIDDVAALASHVIALREGQVAVQGSLVQAAQDLAFQDLLDPRDIGAALPVSVLHRLQSDSPAGAWLRADHVLLASAPPMALSARHVWQGRIAGLTLESTGSVLVRLETEYGAVLARVTSEALRELDLRPEKTAWAVVKAHAV